MTRVETAKILTLLQAEYPNSFANLDAQGMTLKQELWCNEFANDPFDLVFTALRMYMETGERFAPNIGQIRQKMVQAKNQDEMSDGEAWSLVSKACRNGSYGYMKEFAKLPPLIQKAVGRPEQLRDWAAMEESTVQSVVASQFQRSYRAVKERQKELDSYPPALIDMINKMQIGVPKYEMITGGEDGQS